MLAFPNALYAKSATALVTTNWLFPATTGQLGAAPQVTWGSRDNIKLADSAYAISSLIAAAPYTRLLFGTGFNFTGESIPGGATITGFDVEIGRNEQPDTEPGIKDALLYWVDDYSGSTVNGLNMAAGEILGTSANVDVFSWAIPSQGALTKAILEGANFSVIYQARLDTAVPGASNSVARVDYIKCRATYYS